MADQGPAETEGADMFTIPACEREREALGAVTVAPFHATRRILGVKDLSPW